MAAHKQRLLFKRVKIMFIMKSSFKYASPVAGYNDVKILESIGVEGIKVLPNAEAVLTRLVNGDYLPTGQY